MSTSPDSEDPLSKPLREVIEQRDVVMIDDLSPETVGADRAQRAEELGYHSITLVPITYQNALYDVLGIHTAEDTPFGNQQRMILRELGETIGYAMHTAERSRALLSDTTVELEYEIRDESSLIAGLSAALGTEVELERLFFRADDSTRLFLSVKDAELEDIAAHVNATFGKDADVREITTRENALITEVTIPDLPMMKPLAEDMASIRTASADSGDGRMVVEIPNTASVRTLTENLELVFDHVSLLARRQRDRESPQIGSAAEADQLGLTDRQYEVLLTAYHAGFFDWPRESTGEEIAELLDISQPTFHEHLRTGERKVLELLFDRPRSIYA